MASPETLPQLPELPALLLQSPTVHEYSKFTAVGSSIVTMGEHYSDSGRPAWRRYVFDRNSYLGSSDYDVLGAMHCFRLTDDYDDSSKKKGRWSWRHPVSSSPISWSYHPSRIPFDTVAGDIAAYVVHPKGRTFFVSVTKLFNIRDDGVPGLFSYGTESGVWTRRGDCMLPFGGHGHYDGELDSSTPPVKRN
ncbi:hypothetical protein E2562_023878 [Oryza meyeriana var. granulata]|uniref:Uncharacterized protein n=1 Tax=Oryza meyeriana var. granulata TaxID=110450 RepID=A0A6G1D789_9ORYZ|nr:hypothetical protein E2562_023878 [Oryza meyeriana var. granulata]